MKMQDGKPVTLGKTGNLNELRAGCTSKVPARSKLPLEQNAQVLLQGLTSALHFVPGD